MTSASSRRAVIVAALVAAVAVVWLALSRRDDRPRERGADGGGDNHTADEQGRDGGAITKTVSERRVRDDVRKRILERWASDDDQEVAAEAKLGRFVKAPSHRHGDGARDPHYVEDVVRTDLFPLARKCYLAGPGRGEPERIILEVVADEGYGGIVERVDVEGDEPMAVCMRESMFPLALRAPPGGAEVATMVYRTADIPW